jgi:hypothetical protein
MHPICSGIPTDAKFEVSLLEIKANSAQLKLEHGRAWQ